MKRKALIKLLVLGLVFLLPLLTGPRAWSQRDVESAIREVDRPVREEIEERITPPAPEPPRIKEKVEEEKPEGPTFFIKEIKLEGVKSFPLEDFKPIVQKYENREVTVSELKILCKEIEREYLRKGVIAACFLPPQEIKEGLAILRVIEAKMGELEVKEHPFFSKKRIDWYWRIKQGDVLRYDKISRSLQFMNKNPDRNVRATLHAGKKPETTDILLDVKTHFPLHFTATLDNEGAPATGKIRKGLGFVHNNFLGLDDTLMGGYTGGKTFGGIYAYHRVPITNYGTTVLYGYSKTKAFPKKDNTLFEISSSSENYSAFVHQDLYEKDEYKGKVSAGLEAKNKRVVTRSGTLNADRLRIISVAGNFIGRSPGCITYIKPKFSQGLNFLGARRKSEFSSRQAENTFSKFNLGVDFKKALVKNFQAGMKFNSQLASQKLMPQEQFYMGGINSIRGYPSGDYLADTGFYGNVELLVPAFFIPEWVRVPYGERPIKDDITGVLFFDYGYGYKRGKREGELSDRRMASIGAGARIRLLNQALLRLEFGVPLNPLVNTPATEFDRWRLHFSVDFQDKIFDEMERLRGVIKGEDIKKMAWGILDEEMKNPDSPFTKKINGYMYLAQKLREEGNLEKAKEYYAKVYNTGASAYRQADHYVRETIKHRAELKKDNELATQYYKDGEIEKAKEMWEKVKEAKPKPFVIEIL